jgi:hypothetical protein
VQPLYIHVYVYICLHHEQRFQEQTCQVDFQGLYVHVCMYICVYAYAMGHDERKTRQADLQGLYMHVCMYVCICVCMHVYAMDRDEETCMHACVCVCVCVYACMNTCMNTWESFCRGLNIYKHIHTPYCTYVYIHTHTHAHTYPVCAYGIQTRVC